MYDRYVKTRLYNTLMGNPQTNNAIGRTAGATSAQGSDDNFFVKRGKSIENALGTTGAAIASFANDRIENDKTENLLRESKASMNDIAKKYGYNSWSDWQDANAAARESGDTEAIKRFDEQLKEFQAQANANVAKANKKAADYEDYRKNDYISNKINQDQGKFAGSAINTLSTAVDVTGLGANPLSNAIQGGVEGLADELEQNGFENFDWQRAGQNALIGATTGAVTGALNKGISNSLAKNGGNLFKGGNFATRGLNNLGSKTALGRVGSTLATGAARGAVSGAVGGATGAGLQSALNGVEFGQGIQNALQGAAQGAQQGAVTGGIMAGANAALGKTNFGKQLQNAKTNWDQSGSNFDERLTNTLTSGDSAVGDWLMNKRQSSVLGAAGNLGNRVQDVSDLQARLTDIRQRAEKLDAIRDDYGMPDESWRSDAYAYEELLNNPQTRRVIDSLELTDNPTAAQAAAITQYLRDNGYLDTPTTAKGWAKKAGQRIAEDINNSNLGNRIKDVSLSQYENDPGSRAKLISEIAERAETLKSQPRGKYGTNSWDNDLFEYPDIDEKVLDTLGISGDLDGPSAAAVTQVLKEKGIIPGTNTPTTAKGWAKQAGKRIVEDINNSNLGNRIKDVSSDMPEDIRNMQINRNDMLGYEDDNTTPLTVEEVLAREGIDPNSAPRPQATAPAALDAWDRVAQEAGYSNYDEVLQRFAEANPNAKINPRGMAGQVLTWMDNNPNTPTTAAGWAKRAGQRAVEDINNSNLGLRVQDVSQDGAQGATLEADNPQTRLYRMLAGGQASPAETITNAEYGESGLANRTKRGMIADALERVGNTLEGAQSNATRAQLKDLGIESAGKSIENVRKKTGITNLETQGTFAKELTGGADSLMDNVQRLALTESADGKPYTVDTSDISAKVESIVDKYADTNTFGSQSKRNQFISNLRRDISSYDTDVLSIANRMKSNAADYRGRGVADPKPADAAKAKIYTDVANELEDLSYKAIPQENIDAMFDTTISEMQNRAAQAKANGNNEIARAYTKAADQLSNEPRTVKAFRSFKKDFVDVSKINQVSARAENGAAAQMGRSFGSGTKRLTGTLLQRPINAVLAKTGGAINTVADKIDNSGRVVNPQVASPAELANMTADYNPSTQLYNAIGRTEGALAQETPAQYLANAAQEAEIVEPSTGSNMQLASTGNASTSMYNALAGTPTTVQQTNTGSTNTGYYQPTGDYWTDIIASAMSAAIDADDVNAFATLYGMYQDQLANLQKQASAAQSSSQQKLTATQQRANAAMNSLDRLKNMEPDTAYNLSGIPIIGNIATFGGNDYEAEAKSLAQQIGYMVSGSNIKDSEAENIGKSYVPQPWDNETVRQNKLRRAYEIIQRYQNGYAE